MPLTPEGEVCAHCPDKTLDVHHADTCKFGGDVVARHNTLRNVIFEFCKRALLNCHGDSIYCDSNILYYFNPKLSPRVHSFSFPIFVIFECNYSYISVYLAIDQSGF